MHPVMVYFLRVVGQTRHGEKRNAVIGGVICGPRSDLIPELDLCANDLAIPRDHLVEMAGFHRYVMQLGFNHRWSSPLFASSLLWPALVFAWRSEQTIDLTNFR